VSETANFLNALVAHVEDEAGNVVLCTFGEGRDARVWAMAPSRVPVMGEKCVRDWNEDAGRNVYWSAGLRTTALSPGQRGTASDITAMLAIVVDLDDPEAARSWEEKVAKAGPGFRPSAVIRTSFTPEPRYQLVYLLREPTENIEEWRRAARCLEHFFGADYCSKDAAHVWRVPGTTNYPNTKKTKAGRVPELSTLVLWEPDRRFELSDITDNLPEPPAEEVAAQLKLAELPQGLSASWTDGGEIAGCLPGWMQDKLMSEQPHPEGRSHFDWQVAKECARAGLTVGDMLALYRLWQHERFADKWKEKESQRAGQGDEYLKNTYAKAHIEASKEGPLPTAPRIPRYAKPWAEVTDYCPLLDDDVPGQADPSDWADYVKTFEDFKDEEEGPVDYLISPLLQKDAIHMVHGPSGAGKSYFIGHQLYGLAVGKGVGPFTVARPARVLYIDGEMGERTIRARTRGFVRAYGLDRDGNFMLWSPYFAPKGVDINLNVLDPEHQQRIILMATKHKAEVVVIDNIRTCTKGMVENDSDAWEELNRFWRKLRQLGFTVVFVHHDNKSKEDGTYSGSTNAITVVEVQIPVKPMSTAKAEEYSEAERNRSRGPDGRAERDITHAIVVDLAGAKNREKDLSIHKKMELVYVRELEDGKVTMHGWKDKADEKALREADLSTEEKAWALMTGCFGAIPSLREAGEVMKVSHQSIKNYKEKIDNLPEVRAKVARVLAGKR
jgi:KaiC/GvpD/RAD55 family RecA-like ATPase